MMNIQHVMFQSKHLLMFYGELMLGIFEKALSGFVTVARPCLAGRP